MAVEEGNRLDSWKEIGAYFGKTERTVRRWEAKGLPVHRVPGAGTSVYAYTDELDRWLRKIEADPPLPDASMDEAAALPAFAETGVNGTAVVLPRPGRARSAVPRVALVLAVAAILVGTIVSVSDRLGGPVHHEALAATAATSLAPASAAVKRHVPSPEVRDIYLQGVYYWNKRTPDDLNRAVHLFNQAIALDPNYAEAFVGLANTYNLLREYTPMPPSQAYPNAKAAAERAIALDDTLAEAHTALAFCEFFWFWNTEKARREYERALELDPNSVRAHHWFATALLQMGEFDLSLEHIARAQQLDPESRSILADKGLILYYAGREQEAVQLLTQLAEAEPDYLSPHSYLATIYLFQGRYDDHLRMAKQAARLMRHDARLALAEAAEEGYLAGGREGLFAARLEAQKKLYAEGKEDAYSLAATYALLGDAQRALDYLRTSIDSHEDAAPILRIDPSFQALRSNEVFRGMVVEVGLPPIS